MLPAATRACADCHTCFTLMSDCFADWPEPMMRQLLLAIYRSETVNGC